jgi:hypothetical protein
MNLQKHAMIVSMAAILLMIALAVPLSAQSGGNNGKVFISSATGGTSLEQSYFKSRLSEAVRQVGYEVVNTMEASDFYITIDLEKSEGYNAVALALYDTQTEDMIATNAMGYERTSDMDKWNRYLIYELMADAPTPTGTANTDADETASGAKSKSPSGLGSPDYWAYLGARAGYSMRFYTDPGKNIGGFKSDDWPLGNTFEAGIQASGQVLPFLAIQAEGLFTMDTALKKLKKVDIEYKTMSLKFPLVVKFTFRPEQWLIAPLGGIYINAPLLKMRQTIKDDESWYKWKWKSIGWTAGVEVGRRLGPGTLFLDLRYAADIGDTFIDWQGADTSMYRRTAATISLGYDFGLFKK